MHRRQNIQRHVRRRASARARRRRPGFAAGSLRRAAAFVLAAVVLAGLALGAAHHRLRQGPVSLGPVGGLIEQRLSAAAEGLRFEIGEVVFALGEPGRPSGLRLHDVTVRAEDGRRVAAAPELDVDFHLFDLSQGRLAPTRLNLSGARAEIRRDRDGHLRIGAGEAGGALGFVALLDAAARGEGPLQRLSQITAQDAEIRLRDEASGAEWELSRARFAVRRDATGEIGALNGVLRPKGGEGPPMRLTVSGARSGGAGPIRLDLRVGDVPALRLAAPLARVAGWSDAGSRDSGGSALRAAAEVEAVLASSGRPTRVAGRVDLEPGSLPGLPAPFDRLSGGAAEFAWSEGAEAVEIKRLALNGPAGRVALSGRARPWQGAGDTFGLALKLRVSRLEVSAAAGLEAPLVFDDGEIVAELPPGGQRLELSSFRLTGPDLVVRAEGAAAMRPDGPEVAMSFESDGFSTRTLKRAWPESMASNARDWVREHLRQGRVTSAYGVFWAAPGLEPEAAVDFAFEDVAATALREMPPIEGARGEGRITLRRFDLTLAEGHVTPPGGEAIALDGSSFHVPDLVIDPPIGRPVIRAEGRIADILALLDEPPLRLTRKLGAEVFEPSGRAELQARLEFPMIDELQADAVRVEAEADLRDVALTAPGGERELRAEALSLRADTEGLELSGPARIDGLPADVVWTERFGTSPGAARREISARARPGAEMLARLTPAGVQLEAGAAFAALSMSWAAPGALPDLRLDMDLADLAFSVPAIGWRKTRGTPGRLAVSGRREESGALRLDRLALSAPEFEASGTAAVSADGSVSRLALDALRVGEVADLSLTLRRAEDGAREVRARGAKLDLGALARRRQAAGLEAAPRVDGESAQDTPPIRADLELETVRLMEGVTLAGARGALTRARGLTEAELTGRVNGGGLAQLRYRQDGDGAAVITLRSEDAGRLLADLGLSQAVTGGKLKARGRLSAQAERLEGVAELTNIRVAERPALAQMVRRAAQDGVIDAPAPGGDGIVFDRVEVPYVLEGDRLEVTGALASGAALGLKLDGSYDIASGELDLSGVLTPAYAVNSLLNRVPVLGSLLGGEGEGLIGLTFTVTGAAAAPRITANPLSMLAPGALRRIFQAGPSEAAPPDLFSDEPDP
ncbi:MAG: AsmA-like C-terminal region-containing protein [Pseudomonadota bacterium]